MNLKPYDKITLSMVSFQINIYPEITFQQRLKSHCFQLQSIWLQLLFVRM